MSYNKQLKLEKKVCVQCANEYHPWRSNQKNCEDCVNKRLNRSYADKWVNRKMSSGVRNKTQVVRVEV